MYVCLCKGVTDSQIRSAVREGARTVRGLRKQLGCTGQCGKCKQQVRELRDEVLFEQGMMLAPVPSPAFEAEHLKKKNGPDGPFFYLHATGRQTASTCCSLRMAFFSSWRMRSADTPKRSAS
jgi:bacterioferritin-associated ferredoxin